MERILLPPTKPENLTNSSQADTWVYLTWNASESMNGGWIDNYNIWVNDANVANTTDLFYNATGLTASSDYNFTVAAVDNYGLFSENASIIVRTSDMIPSPPQPDNPAYYGGGGGGGGGSFVSYTPPKKTEENTSAPENTTNASAAPQVTPPGGVQEGGKAISSSTAITASATDIQNAQTGFTAFVALVLAFGTYSILKKSFTGFPEKEQVEVSNPNVIVTEVNGQKVFLDKEWLRMEEERLKWKKIMSKPIEGIDIPQLTESQPTELIGIKNQATTKLLFDSQQALGLDINTNAGITYRHPDETIGTGELPITLKPWIDYGQSNLLKSYGSSSMPKLEKSINNVDKWRGAIFENSPFQQLTGKRFDTFIIDNLNNPNPTTRILSQITGAEAEYKSGFEMLKFLKNLLG